MLWLRLVIAPHMCARCCHLVCVFTGQCWKGNSSNVEPVKFYLVVVAGVLRYYRPGNPGSRSHFRQCCQIGRVTQHARLRPVAYFLCLLLYFLLLDQSVFTSRHTPPYLFWLENNYVSPVYLTLCIYTVGGNQNTWCKPTDTWTACKLHRYRTCTSNLGDRI